MCHVDGSHDELVPSRPSSRSSIHRGHPGHSLGHLIHLSVHQAMATNGTSNEAPGAPRTGTVGQSARAILEQFMILSRSAKGLAAVQLVRQCLEHPQIFVFSEILEQPNIKQLSENSEHEPWYRLLELFAFGTYQDYVKNSPTLPPLTNAMASKLRHLTLITLSIRSKRLTYKQLLKELSISNVRELEDLFIEAIYSNVIDGKMDQKNSWIEVDSTIARDVRRDRLESISVILGNWCDSCDNVLATIESQIQACSSGKEKEQKK